MNHFCTYCDRGYAARMLCLHESLRRQGEAFRLFVLCFDSDTEGVVAAARDDSLVAVPLGELLAACPDYAATRGTRSRVEFYFTATAVFTLHCLRMAPEADRITYLDSDLFFFGPASGVFAEQGDASVGIVPHRFPERLKERARHGIYNVGWVSFRRDAAGLACLEWWRERCIEWCFDRVDNGRFADQGYLDEFPRRFVGVRELVQPGVNLAPWNVGGVVLSRGEDGLRAGGGALWFYHYQGVREVMAGWFDPGLGTYGERLTRELRELVYAPYLGLLAEVQARLRRTHGIEPVRGYPRVPATGGGWSGRWERMRAGAAGVWYRRMRGRLIHCREPEA